LRRATSGRQTEGEEDVIALVSRFCWLLALLLLAFELSDLAHRSWLPEPWTLRGAFGLVLLSKTLVLLGPALALAWLCALAGRARLGLLLALIWGVSLASYTAADLVVYARTGNHLSFYLAYLNEEEVGRWGGDLGTGWELARGRMGQLLAIIGASFGLGALVWRARARTVSGSRWLLAGAGIVCVSSLVIQRVLPEPIFFEGVNRAMIIPWNAGFNLGDGTHDVLERELRKAYGRDFEALLSSLVPPESPNPPVPAISPDILIILCDSLRESSFDANTMPRVFRWSRQGARFKNAYAVGNTTPVGMYALLHGFYPFSVDTTSRAERPIPWVRALRKSNYDPVLIQSYRSWRALEGVVNSRDFWIEAIEEGSNWERDRAAVEAAKKLLARGGRPRLVVVHLASTHYVYSYPPQYEEYERDPGVVHKGFFDAYHRSARYLDDLVGSWLEEVDLERNIVIFTSDHGESLGEDGGFFHGSGFSDVQRKVPLVIAGPGVAKGTLVDSIVETVDVVPTLLSLLDLDDLNASLHGRSRLPPTPVRGNYAALFRAPPLGRGEHREVVLLGPDARFLMVLGIEEPTVRVRGRLGADQNDPPQPVDLAESQRIVEWFQDMLERVAGAASVPEEG
jgi:hypothetical protein